MKNIVSTLFCKLSKKHNSIHELLLYFIFFSWMFILIVKLLFSVCCGSETRKRIYKQAVVETKYALPRGTIYDSNNERLAWSQMVMDIHWELPVDINQYQEQYKKYAAIFPNVKLPEYLIWDGTLTQKRLFLVKEDLSAKEVLEIKRVRLPNCKLKGRYVRVYNHELVVSDVIGEVEINTNGEMVGVSGMEKLFDKKLRTRNCKILAMKDRFGHWMPQTYMEDEKLICGEDVICEGEKK